MKLLLSDIFEQQSLVNDDSEQIDFLSFICFSSMGENFFVNINYVKEILDSVYIAPYPVAFKKHVGVINLRGKVVPVLTTHEITFDELDLINKTDGKDRSRIIVLESATGDVFCLIVKDVFKMRLEQSESDIIKISDQPYSEFKLNDFLELTQKKVG